MLPALLEQPAFWGFLGALVYAAGNLSFCLWAGEAAPKGRARTLCIAKSIIATVFGTAGAGAFSVTAHHFFGWAELRACAFVIGGGINEAWPVVRDKIIARLGRFIDKGTGT